jgi:hypothetical protein
MEQSAARCYGLSYLADRKWSPNARRAVATFPAGRVLQQEVRILASRGGAEVLEELSRKLAPPERGLKGSALLFQAAVAARPPGPERSAADQTEVPLRGWPRTSAAKFVGEQRPERHDPSPRRFV